MTLEVMPIKRDYRSLKNTNLSQIENPILNFPRSQWLYNLSYCQWREDEIARGDPWFHLKQIYPDNLK